MKKLLVVFLTVLMAFVLFSCGEDASAKEAQEVYNKFVAANSGDEVEVSGYVVGFESWWSNKQTIYLADKAGNGYLLYEMAISEEESRKVQKGVHISVKGLKGEWSGQMEVTDNEEFVVNSEDTYEAKPIDLNGKFNNEDVVKNYNIAYFTLDVKLVLSKNANQEEKAYLLGYDDSKEIDKCDLYFNVENDGNNYTFNVRRYLTNENTDVYKFVKNLTTADAGKTYTVTAFAYIYDNACQARVVEMQAK